MHRIVWRNAVVVGREEEAVFIKSTLCAGSCFGSDLSKLVIESSLEWSFGACLKGGFWLKLQCNLDFSFFPLTGTVSRMSTSQDQSGRSSNREPLLRCCDARRDLELAIGGVLRAEQQIKDNLQEVWCALFSSLVWVFSTGLVRAWLRTLLLCANQVTPHVLFGMPEMLVPLIPKGN